MRWIAHRGNTNGPSDKENEPEHLLKALQKGYDIEIDVRLREGKIYLGHDEPQHEIDLTFLNEWRNRIWAHAKDPKALLMLLGHDFNCFYHDSDNFTLTGKGFIWANINQILRSDKCVCVMPEFSDLILKDVFSVYAICTDQVELFKREYERFHNARNK